MRAPIRANLSSERDAFALAAENERLHRKLLREAHDYYCGCEDPGNPALCVAHEAFDERAAVPEGARMSGVGLVEKARRMCSGGSVTPGQAAIIRDALDDLEAENERLREALERLREQAAPRKWEAPGHPMNEWTRREPILRIIDEAALAAVPEERG